MTADDHKNVANEDGDTIGVLENLCKNLKIDPHFDRPLPPVCDTDLALNTHRIETLCFGECLDHVHHSCTRCAVTDLLRMMDSLLHNHGDVAPSQQTITHEVEPVVNGVAPLP